MKKTIILFFTLLLMVTMLLTGCSEEYPYQLEGEKLNDYISDINDLPENAEIYALENDEYAIANDISINTENQTYSVVLLDKDKQYIKSYSCEAQDGLEAIKLNDTENISVNKFFGGQSDFTLFNKDSDLYAMCLAGIPSDTTYEKNNTINDLSEEFQKATTYYVSPEYRDGRNFRIHLYVYYCPQFTIYYSFKPDGSVYLTNFHGGCW